MIDKPIKKLIVEPEGYNAVWLQYGKHRIRVYCNEFGTDEVMRIRWREGGPILKASYYDDSGAFKEIEIQTRERDELLLIKKQEE